MLNFDLKGLPTGVAKNAVYPLHVLIVCAAPQYRHVLWERGTVGFRTIHGSSRGAAGELATTSCAADLFLERWVLLRRSQERATGTPVGTTEIAGDSVPRGQPGGITLFCIIE